MKRYILLLIGALSISLSSFTQIKQKITNPIYLGMILIDQQSTDKMAEVCDYYDLMEKPDENGYKVFKHSNGTEFRLRVDKENDKYYPVVKVTTMEPQKSIDEVLSNAGYVKQSGSYVRGSKFEHRRTRCDISGGATKTLTFTKEYRAAD